MIILSLIQNIALLIALAATYQVIGSRFEGKRLGHQLLTGLLFGGVGLVGMMTPVNFSPGIIFDGRSIILSVAGLFGGPLVAAISATICGAYRLWLGGAGAWVGVSVIVESAALGTVFYFLWKGAERPISAFSLYIFGLLVHVVMLALMLALPGGAGKEVLQKIGLPILIVYPFATMLVCRIFLDYETQIHERKALRESEERNRFLAGLIENSSQPFGMGYPDGRLGFVNKAFCDFTGYSEEELRHLDWNVTLTPPEWLEIELQHLAELDREGKPVRYEKEYIRKDGTRVPIELLVHVTRSETGEPIHYQAFVTDLTERKRAERDLQKQVSLMESLVEAIPAPVFFKDTEHIYLGCNRSFASFFGLPKEDIIGQSVYAVAPKEYADIYRKQDEALFENPCPQVYESLLITGDGLKHDVVIHKAPFSDSSGTVAGLVGVVWDVTERKEAEKALQESEQRLELALIGADLGLWDWYCLTDEAVVNRRSAEIIGYSLDEVDKNFAFWKDLVHPDDKQRAMEKVLNHLASSANYYEDEYRVRHKNGDWKWILSRGKVTERDSDGKPLRMTGTYLDITNHKLRELQASEANELREKIVSESPMGIAVYRSNGQCVSANEALGRIVGADPGSLLTQNFRQLSSWKEAGLLDDADQVLSGGLGTKRDAHITTTFGKDIWVHVRMARIMYGGEPHLLLVFNNITERRAAQEALNFEREQLLSIFGSLNEVIMVIDPTTYEILYANRFSEDLYGKELMGGNCYDRLQGFDSACQHCRNATLLELEGKPYRWEYANPELRKNFVATERLEVVAKPHRHFFNVTMTQASWKKATNILI